MVSTKILSNAYFNTEMFLEQQIDFWSIIWHWRLE